MSHKILIVDDDPNALRLVSYAFQAEGYEVSTATTGMQALAMLPTARPELVVLDVMMPDMSGLEVCQRIRANQATARLPILMLSARGLVADRVAGLKSGADDYLPKPADTTELVARAEALLARANQSTAPAAQVLAFMGVKGGAGTTTLAVNTAAAFAAAGKSVCLLELRSSVGTAPMLLKMQPVHDLGELLAKAPEEMQAQDVLGRLIGHASGLRLLAAPQSIDQPCALTAAHVDTVLGHLARQFEAIFVDLPAAWTEANRAAIRRARFTTLVCEPDALSIQCAKANLATLQNWGVMGDLVGLVLVNRGSTSAAVPLPTIRSEARANVVGAIPPAAEPCLAAAREGVPLIVLQPQHIASAAIKDLAVRLAADRVKPLA